ncbi:Jag N-terminal domain-containing protein [Hydrogenimonas sp.]
MKKFEAQTLEEAYAAAAKEFTCSVTELDIQIVQNPSRGFLGFGRKNAVIVAMCKKSPPQPKSAQKSRKPLKERKEKREKRARPKEAATPAAEPEETHRPRVTEAEVSSERADPEPKNEMPKSEERLQKREDEERDIFGNFYDETIDIHAVVAEVERELNTLFASACFKIEPIRVFARDDETIQIEFKGEDAALLIGKEGYRYKALAYLLYNWIHGKYGYRIRLEIAEFLQNQEAMMESYLQPIIERVESEGRAQTKVLDGILVQIALQKLRERYPQKYVAVRTNREGGRYVIVNEFMERR